MQKLNSEFVVLLTVLITSNTGNSISSITDAAVPQVNSDENMESPVMEECACNCPYEAHLMRAFGDLLNDDKFSRKPTFNTDTSDTATQTMNSNGNKESPVKKKCPCNCYHRLQVLRGIRDVRKEEETSTIQETPKRVTNKSINIMSYSATIKLNCNKNKENTAMKNCACNCLHHLHLTRNFKDQNEKISSKNQTRLIRNILQHHSGRNVENTLTKKCDCNCSHHAHLTKANENVQKEETSSKKEAMPATNIWDMLDVTLELDSDKNRENPIVEKKVCNCSHHTRPIRAVQNIPKDDRSSESQPIKNTNDLSDNTTLQLHSDENIENPLMKECSCNCPHHAHLMKYSKDNEKEFSPLKNQEKSNGLHLDSDKNRRNPLLKECTCNCSRHNHLMQATKNAKNEDNFSGNQKKPNEPNSDKSEKTIVMVKCVHHRTRLLRAIRNVQEEEEKKPIDKINDIPIAATSQPYSDKNIENPLTKKCDCNCSHHAHFNQKKPIGSTSNENDENPLVNECACDCSHHAIKVVQKEDNSPGKQKKPNVNTSGIPDAFLQLNSNKNEDPPEEKCTCNFPHHAHLIRVTRDPQKEESPSVSQGVSIKTIPDLHTSTQQHNSNKNKDNLALTLMKEYNCNCSYHTQSLRATRETQGKEKSSRIHHPSIGFRNKTKEI